MRRVSIKMLLPLVAVAFSAIACQNEGQQIPPQQKVTIEASTGVLTRTSLGNDGAVLWSEGDYIELNNTADMSGENYSRFDLVSGAGSSMASFEGVMPEGDVLIGMYGNVYPFYGEGELNVVGVKLAPMQPFMDASFAQLHNPMLAYYEPAQGNNIMFRNVCGLVEFKITGTGTLAEVRVSCGDQIMAGIMRVSVGPDDMDILEVDDETSTAVTVTDINTSLDDSTLVLVYCVLMPGTYDGLTVTMTDTEGNTVTRTAAEPVTVERSMITPVEGLVFDNVVGPAIAINVDEEHSDCFWTSVAFELTGNQEADSFVFINDSKENIDAFFAQTGDPVQALLEYGSPNEGNFALKLAAIPDTYMSIVALALNGGQPVGNVVRYDFMTPSWTIDETLNVTTTIDVIDGVANVTVNISGNATKLYSGVWAGGILDGLSEEQIAGQLTMMASVDVAGTNTYSFNVEEIPEGIELDAFAMAQGENGYSHVSTDTVYVPITPGEDTSEYRRFIGTWMADGLDSMAGSDISFNITVEEDVVGKTYRVSGLANMVEPGTFDDTIIAKFDGTNICFDFGSAAAGLYNGKEVIIRPQAFDSEASQMIVLSQYIGTYADGMVYFGGAECGYDMVDVDVQYLLASCFDMVWHANSSTSGSGAVTEGFIYSEPLSPEWK